MDRKNWMNNLPNNMKKFPLCKLMIPGAHNAASFYCKDSNELIPNSPYYYNVGLPFVRKWAVTQTTDIYKQLCNGIRYFDLRAIMIDNIIKPEHTLVGTLPYIQILPDVLKFLSETKEIVILDFTSLTGLSVDENNKFVNYLAVLFGNYLSNANFQNNSIKDIIDSDRRLLICYNNNCNSALYYLQPKIPSYWPNANTPDAIITAANNTIINIPAYTLFSLQMQITPDATLIIKNLCGSLIDVAIETNANAIEWINKQDKGFIITCDKTEDIVDELVSWNYKRYSMLH
jgi:hypothetical protein